MPWLLLKPTEGVEPAIVRGAERGPDGALRIALGAGPVLLGRSGACDVVVRSGRLAARDTVFEPCPEGWAARNLGTNQGMYVNGQKTMRAVLRHGDVVFLFGIALEFVSSPDPA